jgi:hypothetical protein
VIPLWAKALIVAAIVTGAWLAFDHWRDGVWQAGYDARTDEYDKAAAVATIARQAEVRAIEIAHAAAMAGAAETYERRMTNAQTNATRTAADLLSGSLRLRQHWDACRATAAVSAAVASAAKSDAAAELRRSGAVDLVRLADQCDARIEGLQDVIRIRVNPAQ